jgi:hypothetical protein
MNRDLVYVIPGETHYNQYTLEEYIEKAKRRGEDFFKIQTKDGFTVYESFYRHNTDGTKTIATKSYLKEDELTPKEAIEAMLNGERLVDYKHTPDIAQYRWNGNNFIVYDSYEYDSSKIIKSFTRLHRHISDKEKELEREQIRVKEKLGFDLDLSGMPIVERQYGLKGAMLQAISMCEAQKWDLTEEHVHSVLANLDSDLESMFS